MPAGQDDAHDKWQTTVPRGVVRQAIEARTTSHHDRRALETKIGQTLHKLCPGIRAKRVKNKGGQRYWVHVFPSLNRCRAAFERAVRMRINWKTGQLETGDGP
jgi:hypothetical protein